ncbi:hypothetical protein K3495_g7052 [Podosphaera aphanis]|nr:hypothetical protein K3495_g7052 [Podosphaera aphanis]
MKLKEKEFETSIEALRITPNRENIYAYAASTQEKSELMERMDDWKDVLGERAAISPQVYPIIMSTFSVLKTNLFELHTVLDKLMNDNKGTVPEDSKIRKIYWLFKPMCLGIHTGHGQIKKPTMFQKNSIESPDTINTTS